MISRCWGIRHLRYWWLRYRLERWFDECQRRDLGLFVNPSDVDYLDRVWRGER